MWLGTHMKKIERKMEKIRMENINRKPSADRAGPPWGQRSSISSQTVSLLRDLLVCELEEVELRTYQSPDMYFDEFAKNIHEMSKLLIELRLSRMRSENSKKSPEEE